MRSITPQELHGLMNSSAGAFILDVRAEQAYQEWRIQHRNIQSVNVQTSKLKAHGPEMYPEIPRDRQVVVVCARGHASREATGILLKHGYDAINLEGGMSAWSQFYYPVLVMQAADFELYQIIRPAKGCLSYLLVSGGEAIVVDPARHIDVYLGLARDRGARIKYVLDTHCHADHISGASELARAAGATYWIGDSDMQGAAVDFQPLTDGMKFDFGTSTLEAIAVATPGHTPGSMSFLVNGRALLSGDTLFVSGLGRPDLGGKAREWARLLYDTVKHKLCTMDGKVLVLPAHFSDIREMTDAGYVGAELQEIRQTNELLCAVSRDIDAAAFAEAVAGQVGQTPPNYTTIVNINRGLMIPTFDEAAELEIGPNRCAVKHNA